MDDDTRPRNRHIPTFVAGLLITASVVSRSGSSILTPLWLDALNNSTVNSSDLCGNLVPTHHIDAYTTMFIVNFLFMVLFGLVLLFTCIVCPGYISARERNYDKREFALIGVSDTLAAVCFVYASSGCRTAPYLQSLAANFSVPVTFFIRYLVLRKRPTCRKTICAMLVLFAEFTALVPDIFPELESHRAKKDEGGADGIAGILWPLCFFFGYIPLAMVTTVMEKAVKSSSADQRIQDSNTDLNIAYVLFWSYFFSLLTLILLFWTDFIPGFGMADGIIDFAQGFWFNIKCFFAYEGCRGLINLFSVMCTVLLVVNRVANSFFLRYLEGANYLVIITTVQTPIVFIFFTLFDDNPIRWHPHAYLSTWLSVAALCIMIPAIYIYDTGAPEVQPDVVHHMFVDSISQTISSDPPSFYGPGGSGNETHYTEDVANGRQNTWSQTDPHPGETNDRRPLLEHNDDRAVRYNPFDFGSHTDA